MYLQLFLSFWPKHLGFCMCAGVDDIEIDMATQKVTVTGWADQKKVLKAVRKTGRRAELWQLPYNPEHQDYTYHYYNQHNCNGPLTYYAPQPASSYNYYKHGYNDQAPSYHQNPSHSTIFGYQTGATFSDENPNGCSIMWWCIEPWCNDKCLSLKTICCGFKFGNQFLHIKLGIRLSFMISFRLCKSESFVHWIQLIFLSVLFFYFCDFFFQFVLLSYNLMQKHGFPTTYDWNTILYNVKNTQFAIAINYGFQTMGS